MKSSEILRKAAELIENSSGYLYRGWGLCHYCWSVEVPAKDTHKVLEIISRIQKGLGDNGSLQNWLLHNSYISYREYMAISYDISRIPWWKVDTPITQEEQNAARLKLKNTRIAWAKSLAEEFEKEGD